VSDNNEFIVINVAPLLDCGDEGRRGKHGHRRHPKDDCEVARD
jgi:hypothetical protein